jgi:hypothetical protein
MTRHICDGHEYRVVDSTWPDDTHMLLNNYGSEVAYMSRSACGEYWHFMTRSQECLGRVHEDNVIDNTLDQELVHRYVAWATDHTLENAL